MIKAFISRQLDRLKTFEATKVGKQVIRWISLLFTVIIVAYLVSRLTLIGWENVLQSLPGTPWFYFLLLILLFSLPLFQVLIFRVAWKTYVKPWALFLALLNKRVLDKDVMGYSGEMYLYFWARKHVKRSDKEILHIIKDNVILSSTASTIVALVLLILFFTLGRVTLPDKWLNPNITYVILLVFCMLMTGGFIIKFRKSIFFLPRKELLKIFGLHVCRLLVVQGLQIVQWIVVLPEIPIVNWLTLLAIQIIITRIPLLPSRDLIFLGTGVQMSSFIQVSTPDMAAMLLASSVINKILNLFFFVLVYFTQREKKS